MQTKKSKLIVLLLLFVSAAFGQQVPNTTTFKLDTVVDVVGPTTNDLLDCFSDANPDYFNDTYNDDSYAPANSLLRFRDYGAHNAAASAPTVVTGSATNLTAVGADLAGNVTSDGGSTITERGFEIATNIGMTGAVSYPQSGTTGSYSQTISNLTCSGTTYYYRAYAVNTNGYGYGSVSSFSTSSPSLTAYSLIHGFAYNDGSPQTYGTGTTSGGEIVAEVFTTGYYNGYAKTSNYTTGYLSFTSLTVGAAAYYNSSTPYCIKTDETRQYVYLISSQYNIIQITNGFITSIKPLYRVELTTSSSWVCPAGIATAKIECWGGGGPGGSATGTGAMAAGGAGGSYARKTITVVPGTSYPYTIATVRTASTTVAYDGNNTFFGSASFATALVAANGGKGGGINSTTGGASAVTAVTTGCIGDVIYSGGNGGAGTSGGYSGAGGSGAGSSGNGNNASNNTAGAAKVEKGGAGYAGRNTSGSGGTGNPHGGGGAGGCATTSTDGLGGTGAAGIIRIVYY